MAIVGTNRRVVFGIVALAVCAARPLRAQQQPTPVGFGRAVGQTVGGVAGTALGFVAGGLATRWVATRWAGASDDQASSIAMAGAYVGSALATAAGPTIVGPGSRVRGSYWAALAGATAGGVGSFLVIHLNRAVDLGTVPRLLSAAAVVVLPAIGATVGYNLSRRSGHQSPSRSP
jgi:hypothetical protein